MVRIFLAFAFTYFCSALLRAVTATLAPAFPAALAGRVLSAFNLVIFAGVFAVQWGLGLLVDAFLQGLGAAVPAYQAAFALWGGLALASYLWLLWATPARPGAQTCP
jgi:hypothetical protein